MSSIVIDLQFISENAWVQLLEKKLGLPRIELSDYCVENDTAYILPFHIVEQNRIFPFKLNQNNVAIATSEPLNILIIDEIKLITGKEVEIWLATPGEIDREIKRFFDIKEVVEKEVQLISKESVTNIIDNKNSDQNLNFENEAPAIKIIDTVIKLAIDQEASDIHFEPTSSDMLVRFRVDGMMRQITCFPKHTQELLISRIKIMTNMDITVKRLPQDGRCEFTSQEQNIDLRASALPTIFGEKIVIRLLYKEKIIFPLDKLGFKDKELSQYKAMLADSSGMILVTGPTGCGKTTTLYSSLSWINSPEKNIITVEDPVEYQLPGVNQVEMNEKAGLTFAIGLRSILRQDPDIIMIGEIRDLETARIAVRSSLTGHLVFSTLHTSNSIGALSRLIDMGIPMYLLNSSIKGILSQRLVRKICNHCKELYQPSFQELNFYEAHANHISYLPNFFRGRGCRICNGTGYQGRKAVFELLVVDNQIKKEIAKGVTKLDDLNFASVWDCLTLVNNALQDVNSGITTLEEVIRITSFQESLKVRK
ncbi:GspE/PulE family protein [Natranaerobius thermophilus JW/NM-WN-LF]